MGIVAAVLASMVVAPQAQAATVPAFDHVFLIVMENHSYGEIIGSSQAPYTNRLASSGAVATNYHGVTHPSLPNYLALTSGSTDGITSDCTTCFLNVSNLGDVLEAGGSTWKSYEEGLPSPCFVGDSYPYAQKHDPFLYYDDIVNNSARCQSHIVPYAQLATDLRATGTTPNFSFITPNMCNDMHDCTVATGDAWLQSQVPQILSSPAFTTQHSLLALTWDEDDFTTTNQVPLILVGSGVRPGYQSTNSYDHYSLLHTIEAARGVAALSSNDANAALVSDVFAAAPPPSPSPSPSPSPTPSPLPANVCTSVGLSSSPSSPQPPGTGVTLTASSTGCPNPLYELRMTPPSGGPWQLKMSYSSTSVITWNNTGISLGTYGLMIRARDSSSAGAHSDSLGSYDASDSSQTFTLATVNPPTPSPTPTPSTKCTTVTAAESPTSPQQVGTAVSITASAGGCSNPRYEFWTLAPGSQTWTSAQPYSTSATYAWDTRGKAAGTWRFSVWAEDASSSGAAGNVDGTWDVYVAPYYALQVDPCASAMWSGAPASTAVTGTLVTLTAAASGCTSPRYQFEMLSPGSQTWRVVEPYSNSAIYTWSTIGQVSGTYRFIVMAQDSTSPGAYRNSQSTWDAYVNLAYTLTSTPCASVTASSSSGTPTLISAVASACPSPSFQFELLAPGSQTWQVLQAYSPKVGFSWNTTGAAKGTWTVIVKARDASSAGTFSNYAGTWDAYALITVTLN